MNCSLKIVYKGLVDCPSKSYGNYCGNTVPFSRFMRDMSFTYDVDYSCRESLLYGIRKFTRMLDGHKELYGTRDFWIYISATEYIASVKTTNMIEELFSADGWGVSVERDKSIANGVKVKINPYKGWAGQFSYSFILLMLCLEVSTFPTTPEDLIAHMLRIDMVIRVDCLFTGFAYRLLKASPHSIPRGDLGPRINGCCNAIKNSPLNVDNLRWYRANIRSQYNFDTEILSKMGLNIGIFKFRG